MNKVHPGRATSLKDQNYQVPFRFILLSFSAAKPKHHNISRSTIEPTPYSPQFNLVADHRTELLLSTLKLTFFFPFRFHSSSHHPNNKNNKKLRIPVAAWLLAPSACLPACEWPPYSKWRNQLYLARNERKWSRKTLDLLTKYDGDREILTERAVGWGQGSLPSVENAGKYLTHHWDNC